jgi:hypothetical protein
MCVVLPEYAICSNRGLCDVISGTCLCFNDYAGSNCDRMDYDTTTSTSNALPGLSLSAVGLDYTGNIGTSPSTTPPYGPLHGRCSALVLFVCLWMAVELVTQKAGAPDFYFLYCEAGGRVMASITVRTNCCGLASWRDDAIARCMYQTRSIGCMMLTGCRDL